MRGDGRRQRLEHRMRASGVSPPRNSVAWPPAARRGRADGVGAASALCSQRCAPPHSISWLARQVQRRRRRRHRQPPQGGVLRRSKNGCGLLAQAAARSRRRRPLPRRRGASSRRIDRGSRARQAHAPARRRARQLAEIGSGWPPHCVQARERVGLGPCRNAAWFPRTGAAAPSATPPAAGPACRASRPAAATRRSRRRSSSPGRRKCSTSPRPSISTAPSTKSRSAPTAGAARAGQARGDHAAQRGASAEMRRLEGQHLVLLARARLRSRPAACRCAR